MPTKYSHVQKRIKTKNVSGSLNDRKGHAHRHSNMHIDRTFTQAINDTMTAISDLERAISSILLLRYEQDISRLYSARLQNIALTHLPHFIMKCIKLTSPGWVAVNASSEEVKDLFRGAIAMDLRQAGERVATKSVLWSYTALRHFALSNNVHICQKRGLKSFDLLPHFQSLSSHLDMLKAMPKSAFSKPTHLPPLEYSIQLLEDDLAKENHVGSAWADWRRKVQIGYKRLADTLWQVAREFDVRGYGIVLREKLTTKWCHCGCSTDHLGEVCEKSVREEEEESGIRSGKEKEWDGRGSGVFGWETYEEEDIWEVDPGYGSLRSDECDSGTDMTVEELMTWRYIRAEKAKEKGNKSFREDDYKAAIKQYTTAYEIEPELPYYQLNIAAAYLKLSNWIEAEKACSIALSQHRSCKGYWRRARARRMQGRIVDAVKDLRMVLKIQPNNVEALTMLTSLLPTATADLSPQSGSLDEIISGQDDPQDTYSPDHSSSSSSQNDAHIPSGSASASSKHESAETLPWIPSNADKRKLKFLPLAVQYEAGKLKTETIYKGRSDAQPDSCVYPSWRQFKIQYYK